MLLDGVSSPEIPGNLGKPKFDREWLGVSSLLLGTPALLEISPIQIIIKPLNVLGCSLIWGEEADRTPGV